MNGALQGDYAVRAGKLGKSERRPSDAGEAIDRARELSPGATPYVERCSAYMPAGSPDQVAEAVTAGSVLSFVMPGLDPGIHDLRARNA